MMSMTAEQILATDDLPREKISIPAWGGDYWIRTLTAEQREEWEQSRIDARATDKAAGDEGAYIHGTYAGLAAMVLVDEQGNRVFRDDQIEALAKKSSKILGRIFAIAGPLNGLTPDVMETIAKN